MKVSTVGARLALVCLLSLGFCSCTSDTAPPSLNDYQNPKSVGPAPVAVTGQETCYNADGRVIDCASTGQDGDLQKGVPFPDPRFADNGDGTVTDYLTGLMWMKDSNCIKETHPGFDNDGNIGDGKITWQHGLDFAAAVNSGTYDCGITTSYNDWRVPNEREIESLIDFTPQYQQAITLGMPSPIWTSSSVINPMWENNHAWAINSRLYMAPVKKTLNYSGVWLVRSALVVPVPAPLAATGQTACYDLGGFSTSCAGTGQDGELQKGITLSTPRFTDNGDGTVSDNLTGLMWMKDSNCIGNLLPDLDRDDAIVDGRVTWQHGLDFIAGLNYGAHNCGNGGDYTDWRMPNIKDLRGLTSSQFSWPAVSNSVGDGKWSNDGDPFNGMPSVGIIIIDEEPQVGVSYWSSTTRIGSSYLYATPGVNAMTLELNFGFTAEQPKKEQHFVWPVRGGN